MKNLQTYRSEFDTLSSQEDIDLEKAIRSVKKFVESSDKISDLSYSTRDAHAKTYATVKAQLHVSKDLPAFINEIFNEESYEVTARFSNGNLVVNKTGREMPLYGFSLKIKNVQGRDVNYPLVNFPLFPTNSPSVFLKLFTSVNTFLVTKADNFVVAALDLPHLFKNAASLVGGMLTVDVRKSIWNLLGKWKDFFFSFDFAGIGCYRVGNHIMKITLKPINIDPTIGRKEPQKNSIKWFLSTQDSAFDVMLQFSENLEEQPINDLMTKWKNAPEYCLGQIIIAKSSLLNSDNPDVENLNFDPFENKENLQPVGRIQQIRKRVYTASIETRNSLNENLLKIKSSKTL